jgi:hypothetical protein
MCNWLFRVKSRKFKKVVQNKFPLNFPSYLFFADIKTQKFNPLFFIIFTPRSVTSQ